MRTIEIRKGLDVPLGGNAAKRITDARCEHRYAVKPAEIVGFTPRLLVAVGDVVVAGQPLVADKADPRLCLPSPVDGVVADIVRGEKRKLLEVVVERQGSAASTCDGQSAHGGQEIVLSPESPCWWMLRERPFGTIANPDHKPKGIYVSMRDTNPLAPDVNYALEGRMAEFDAGVAALGKLAEVHVVYAKGPHPAGNIGTIVAALDPINKGECVWHVGAQDVANIGRWVLTGRYCPEMVVAVGGPAARNPHYYRVIAGSCLKSIAEAQLINYSYPGQEGQDGKTRIVSGSALSGSIVEPDGFLGPYDQQVTFLAEGDHHEVLGWLMPGLDKHSFSRTFVSGMLGKFNTPDCNYNFDTNLHGGRRPLMFTGGFERVCPIDIYPMQLIKACIVGDVELQEKLGIYEVEPEDFALCEYIDPSKTEIQTIIRNALEVLRKEATA